MINNPINDNAITILIMVITKLLLFQHYYNEFENNNYKNDTVW